MAVLAQQVQRGVRGVAPLALEGDEDGSARELQQSAQALPAGTGPSGEARGRPPHPARDAPEAVAAPGPAQEGV